MRGISLDEVGNLEVMKYVLVSGDDEYLDRLNQSVLLLGRENYLVLAETLLDTWRKLKIKGYIRVDKQGPTFSRDSITGQEQQNDNSENWEIWLSQFKKEHGDYYFRLLQLFGIQPHNNSNNQCDKNQNPEQEKQQINALENAIKNPQKLLEVFHYLDTKLIKWHNSNQESQKKTIL